MVVGAGGVELGVAHTAMGGVNLQGNMESSSGAPGSKSSCMISGHWLGHPRSHPQPRSGLVGHKANNRAAAPAGTPYVQSCCCSTPKGN